MNLFSVLFVFLVSWWLILFTVLPFGIEQPEKAEKGHDAGAPINPHLKLKFIVTTVLAMLATAGVYVFLSSELAQQLMKETAL